MKNNIKRRGSTYRKREVGIMVVLKDFNSSLNLDLGHFKEIQGKKKLDPRPRVIRIQKSEVLR